MQPLRAPDGYTVVAADNATHVHDRRTGETCSLEYWIGDGEAAIRRDTQMDVIRPKPTTRYLTVAPEDRR